MEILTGEPGDRLVFDEFEVHIIREAFRERARKFASEKRADRQLGRFTLDLAFYELEFLEAFLPTEDDYADNTDGNILDFNHCVIVRELDTYCRSTSEAIESIRDNFDIEHIYDEPEELVLKRTEKGLAAKKLHTEIVEQLTVYELEKSGGILPDMLS